MAPVAYYLNGHSFIEQELKRAGIGFRKEDNAFLAVDDVAAPRAKTSITIMRAPQCGHGQRSTRGASGVISGCFRASTAGGSAPSSARAVAVLSARLALAKSPPSLRPQLSSGAYVLVG